MRLVVNIAFALAVSAALLYAFWRWFGAFGLVFAMPVISILAMPIVEILTGFPSFARRLALRRVEGRYFEFRGRAIDIHIDADARCWVSTADARKIVALPADPVLCRLAPLHCAELGEPRLWRITPEGLAELLARSSDAEVTKFCRWLEVDVARPARNKLERMAAAR
jgi:hypothetical protein